MVKNDVAKIGAVAIDYDVVADCSVYCEFVNFEIGFFQKYSNVCLFFNTYDDVVD